MNNRLRNRPFDSSDNLKSKIENPKWLGDSTRLPVMYTNPEPVLAGGLASYAADLPALAQGAANYVDRVFKGARPADLPVQQPTKFEFIVNLKAAKQIGLTIPPNVLARADKVIR